MATGNASTAFQGAAQCLAATANRSVPECLFHEALEEARVEVSNAGDIKLLEKLASIHDEKTMRATLEHELQHKRNIGEHANRKFDRRIARLCARLDTTFEFARRISECNQSVAKPVVGVICLVVTVLQDLSVIDDSVTSFDKSTRKHLEAFDKSYMEGQDLNKPLRESLKDFYRVLISFGCTVIPWSQSHPSSTFPVVSYTTQAYMAEQIWRLFTGNPKAQVEGLLHRLQQSAVEVHQAASSETWKDVKAIMHTVGQPQVVVSAPTSLPTHRNVNIQRLLTPTFSGRVKTLQKLANTLGDCDPSRPKDIALFGLPGVGKTQLSLHYAERTISYKYRILIHAKDKAIIQTEVRRIILELGLVRDAVIPTMAFSLLVAKFRGWLSTTTDWLLIFDDVTENIDLQEIRPSNGSGHVIYTTRNKHTAEMICGVRTQEIEIMDSSDSVALIRACMGAAMPSTPDAEAQAKEVADFAKGLPLALEQVAFFARAEDISLDEALQTVKHKAQFLKQKPRGSFHQANLATGSILVAAFEALMKRSEMAGALFQVLSYLGTSSIPLSMLEEAARQMENYLTRSQTFDRGAVRGRQRSQRRQQMLRIPTFRLTDYDGPLDAKLYHRLLKTGEFRKYRQPRLPRADSLRDLEMQIYWQSDGVLQGVFNSQNQLARTVTEVVSSGLVRRLDDNSLWIHDLFAELMTAHIADDSATADSSMVHIHTAATMVWLAFPITMNLREASLKSFRYLPHGESCLRHLREHGTLLMDATVGAELSQVVASTISHRGHFAPSGGNGARVYKDPNFRKSEWERAVGYYKDALRCYIAAHKRMMESPKLTGWKGLSKVCRVAQRDIAIEIESYVLSEDGPLYTPESWLSAGNRYGSTPLWRVLQTAGQIGMLYSEMGSWDQAIWYFTQCRRGVQCLWGTDENYNPEAEALRGCLVYAYQHKGDHQAALKLLLEQKKVLELDFGIKELTELFGVPSVMEFAARLASCYTHLKRYDEALMWFKVAYQGMKSAHGQYGHHMWGSIESCVQVCEKAEDWEGALDWWFEALGVLLHARNQESYRIEAFMKGFPIIVDRWRESLNGQVEERTRSGQPIVRTGGRCAVLAGSSGSRGAPATGAATAPPAAASPQTSLADQAWGTEVHQSVPIPMPQAPQPAQQLPPPSDPSPDDDDDDDDHHHHHPEAPPSTSSPVQPDSPHPPIPPSARFRPAANDAHITTTNNSTSDLPDRPPPQPHSPQSQPSQPPSALQQRIDFALSYIPKFQSTLNSLARTEQMATLSCSLSPGLELSPDPDPDQPAADQSPEQWREDVARIYHKGKERGWV